MSKSFKQAIFSIVPKKYQKRTKNLYYDKIIMPSYDLLHLYHYGFKDFFNSISIETTTHCNLRCTNCPNSIYDRGIVKNKKNMDIELFKKIINDLAQINYRGTVMLHFYGDPLTDERMPELCKYVKEKLPKSFLQLNSNGFLLKVELYNILLKSGVDNLFITQYGEIMPPNVKKVYDFLDENPDVKNIIQYRVFKEIKMSNRGGMLDINDPVDYERPICLYPHNSLIVDYNGNVILCCNDYFSTIKFGNLKDKNLLDVWNNHTFKKIRDDIKNKNFKLPICKKCVGIQQ